MQPVLTILIAIIAADASTARPAAMATTAIQAAIKKTPAGEWAGEKRWKDSSAAKS